MLVCIMSKYFHNVHFAISIYMEMLGFSAKTQRNKLWWHGWKENVVQKRNGQIHILSHGWREIVQFSWETRTDANICVNVPYCCYECHKCWLLLPFQMRNAQHFSLLFMVLSIKSIFQNVNEINSCTTGEHWKLPYFMIRRF